MTPAALLSALALLAAGPAPPGQASDVGIDQIGTQDAPGAAARDIGDMQLGDARPVIEPALPAPAPSPLTQLNEERPTAAPPEGQPAAIPFERPQQLNEQRATAEAPSGPASPFPRRATVDPVSGDDSCDPARAGAQSDEVCANRIETRADEFAPAPAPVLSAEERLMGTEGEPGEDAEASARRLASGDVQNSEAAEAYVFTTRPTPNPDASASNKVSPETQRAMDAAAQLLGVLPASAIISPR